MVASLLGISWSSPWAYVMLGGLVVATIFGTWAGAVAGSKGKNASVWFLIGFFFPIIGIIAAYVIKPTTKESKKQS